MNLRGSSIIFIVLLVCAFAYAGDLHVTGEVTGTWTAGTHVFVSGPVNVPASGSLTIEPDVSITFETDEPFVVHGGFHAVGDPYDQIVLHPQGDWAGFQFGPYPETRVMHFVRVDTVDAIPSRVIVSQTSDLDIFSCNFIANRSCIEIYGGQVQLRESFLLSRALFSKTVILEDLASDPLRRQPCSSTGHSSRISDNILIARCAYDGENDWYPRDAYTCAMVVERSTNICFSENTFTVEAPWTCIGVHFGELPATGDPVWFLNYATVAVKSFDGMPLGVNKANDGYLLALRLNLDVGKLREDNYYTSTGVRASNDAQIVLNSSALVLDEGDNFFMSVSGALLTVDYNTYWSTGSAGPNGGAGGAGDDALDTDDPDGGVIFGLHNINANPLFAMDGDWGRWCNKNDVRRYYSLLAGSPCIDAGDTLYGNDRDGTFPDIGHFPYEGMSVGNPHERPALPADVAVGLAFPNPFNLNTTVPFELRQGGLVTFSVHDVMGRSVVNEVIGPLGIGRHEIVWDAIGAGSGTYFVTIGLNGLQVRSQQVYLLK